MAMVTKTMVKKSAGEMRISGEFWDALDKKVDEVVKAAIKRAKANARKTLKAADL